MVVAIIIPILLPLTRFDRYLNLWDMEIYVTTYPLKALSNSILQLHYSSTEKALVLPKSPQTQNITLDHIT